jgi:anti-sigma factor RsiW
LSDCERYEQLASALVDCEATRIEREQFYAHLVGCEQCDAFFADVFAMQLTLARGTRLAGPADERLRRISYRHHPVRWSAGAAMRTMMKKRLSVPLPIAGGILVVAAIIALLLSGPREPVPVEENFQAARVNQSVVALPVVRIP